MTEAPRLAPISAPLPMTERFTVHKHFKIGVWIWVAAVLAAVGWVISTLATSKNAHWDVFGTYFFNGGILDGVGVTIELTFLTQVIAIVLGFITAYAARSAHPVARSVAFAYVWLFRGTPLLVQLLLWFNIALFVPHLTLGLPFLGWSHTWDTNVVVTGFSAALLGLGLNEGAYMSEIFRSGFLAVPRGQVEAALSIGLRRGQVLRRIVLPLSIRVIIPPTGNQFVGLLKTTSLVSVIGGGDLLTRSQYIYGQNLQVVALLFVASVWYLLMVSLAQVGQYYLERAFSSDRTTKRRGQRARAVEVAL